MSLQIAAEADIPSTPTAAWGAIAALTLCVATLIASEFMPVSLLTPITADLRITEGQAGQAIAVSGVFAVLTSLLLASATRRIDRKHVLLALTAVMIASGLMVSLAPNAAVFMAGRALVGVVIGGFWSMSAATVMRLAPEPQVPRALGMLNGGNALATTIAAPLGSFLGQYIGWRGAFFIVVPLGALSLVWLHLSFPTMAPAAQAWRGSIFRVLRRPGAPLGFAAVAALFAGQFALFTYLRPFLETVTGLSVSALSLVLLTLGAAGLLGTYLIGLLLPRRLGGLLIAAAVLLAAWGLVGTAVPVAWWTWLSKTLPNDAEAGGGLMVAVVQLAITLGAALGGVLVDARGYQVAFGASAAILLAAASLAFAGARRASIAPTNPNRRGSRCRPARSVAVQPRPRP